MQIVAVFDSFLFLMNIPRSGRLEVKKQTTQRWLSPLSHYLFKLEKSSVTKLVSEGIHRQITDSRRNKTSRIKQISKHFVERSYRADPLQLHEAFFFFPKQNSKTLTHLCEDVVKHFGHAVSLWPKKKKIQLWSRVDCWLPVSSFKSS